MKQWTVLILLYETMENTVSIKRVNMRQRRNIFKIMKVLCYNFGSIYKLMQILYMLLYMYATEMIYFCSLHTFFKKKKNKHQQFFGYLHGGGEGLSGPSFISFIVSIVPDISLWLIPRRSTAGLF